MAKRYELSLSPAYVPDWDAVDAVREFFQNALDQETTMEDNKMFFEYDEEQKQLRIGNKHSVLQKSSLLLGVSTKRHSSETIGQFGEGYKIASLVLTRMGCKVTVYNYGAREVWTAKMIKSRRYDSDILVFDVDTKYPWTKVPDNNLTITIDGIFPALYERIVESNLHLQDDLGKTFDSLQGRVLLDDKYKGKVFVKGLHVVDFPSYHYGYDFEPSYIKLDRDRKMVSDFELQWAASGMWNNVPYSPEVIGYIKKLMTEGAQDVRFIASNNKNYDIIDQIALDFYAKYGENAVPVASQYDFDKYAAMGLSPRITSLSEFDAITKSTKYKNPYTNEHAKVTPLDQLKAWRKKYYDKLPHDALNELDLIIGRLSY